MIDPYLNTLAKKIEQGAECLPVWMTLYSGDRVTGTPRPSRDFVDGTFHALQERLDRTPQVQHTPKADRPALREQLANAAIQPFNVEIDPASGTAMTLANATVMWGGATTEHGFPS